MFGGAQVDEDRSPHGLPAGQRNWLHTQESLREDSVSVRYIQEQWHRRR